MHEFPHISIIDPRTGRLLWRKEGWTQEKPFTAERFAEMAMDFCSRHSFDKGPVAPSKKHSATPPAPPASALPSKPAEFMTEDEQLQAALSASLSEPTVKQAPKEINIDDDDDDNDNVIEIDKDRAQKMIDDEDDDDDIDEYVMEEDDDDGDDDVQYLGTQEEMDATSDLKPAAVPTAPPAEEKPEPPKPVSLTESLLAFAVSDEPPTGARIQLRMPDAKRLVRKFDTESSVKTIYAFVAVRTFVLILNGRAYLLFFPTVCHFPLVTILTSLSLPLCCSTCFCQSWISIWMTRCSKTTTRPRLGKNLFSWQGSPRKT